METCLRYVRALLLSTMLCFSARAQSLLPQVDGQLVRFNASIDFKRGGMSGICALRLDSEELKGSLFNEFGISALDFTCQCKKRKVRIVNAISMLNKWYIKRVLRQDLMHVVDALGSGDTTYVNTRRHITYQFSRMPQNDTEE